MRLPNFCLAAATLLTLAATASPRANAGSLTSKTPSVSSELGEWTAPFPFPTLPIHAHLLPTGKVMFWDRHDVPEGDGHPRLWDPGTGVFSLAPEPPPGHDLFCSGHTFLEDGKLFVAGGHFSDGVGQPFVSTFDPFKSSWSMLPEMEAGRWYPTAAALADGSVLVAAGGDEEGHANTLPQIYRPSSRSWEDLPGAVRVLPYYPFAFPAPDDRVFFAGPEGLTRWLDLTTPGAWIPAADTGHGQRSYGSAVAYAEGRILLVGGGDPPTASTQVIDLRQAHPEFRELAPMAEPRRQLNLTLLPDGTVLATGGTSAAGFNNSTGAVLATELWNPATESWTEVAPASVPRLYHSIALLLPDGRVLSAGGGHPNDSEHDDPNHFDGQIYSPPYLFRGPRPTIVTAPESVHVGESFSIALGPESPAAEVTWLRLGSVTHAFNMNQRFVRLASTATATGRTVVAPSDLRLALPGHYLMFALSSDGVPSIGKIVQLRGPLFDDGFEDGSGSNWSEVEAGPPPPPPDPDRP